MRLQTKRSSRAESTGRSWGFIATNIPDPPACISECRAQLLETLLQGDETMQRACELLSDTTFAGREEAVQALYCCDSQRCGVDHLGKPGQDPNVNWIINTCQNFGYVPIIDNGPPASDYLCSCASVLQPSACSGGTSSTPSVAIASAGSPSPDSTEQRHTSAAAASNHIQTASAQPEPTHSIVQSPSVAADSSQPSSQDGGGPQADLSAGVVVTIVMSTMVGIVLLAGLTMWLMRSKWRPHWQVKGIISSKQGHIPPGSPTPQASPNGSLSLDASERILVSPPPQILPLHSPSSRSPRSPPPRLGDRKLLSVMPVPPDLGGRPLDPSPVSAFSTEDDPPEAARSPWFRKPGQPAMLSRITPPAFCFPKPSKQRQHNIQSSHGSHASTLSPTASTLLSTSRVSQAGAGNTYPQRLVRNFDMSVDVSALACPGPPPNKALPTPPSPAYSSASKSAGRRWADGDVSPGQTPTANHSRSIKLSSDAQELCLLTEECASEPRDSWGSWRGSGGGGPVVGGNSAKTKAFGGKRRMDEEDLERLGGKYPSMN